MTLFLHLHSSVFPPRMEGFLKSIVIRFSLRVAINLCIDRNGNPDIIKRDLTQVDDTQIGLKVVGTLFWKLVLIMISLVSSGVIVVSTRPDELIVLNKAFKPHINQKPSSIFELLERIENVFKLVNSVRVI